jgi:hypothetical protein
VCMFHDYASFYGEDLSASRATPKLEDHSLSAVRDCLFNIFAATLHIGGRSSHPQPEDAPCRGNRDGMALSSYQGLSNTHTEYVPLSSILI